LVFCRTFGLCQCDILNLFERKITFGRPSLDKLILPFLQYFNSQLFDFLSCLILNLLSVFIQIDTNQTQGSK